MNKRQIKKILGELPYTAELYWHLIQQHKRWQAHFNLDFLESKLPEIVRQTEMSKTEPGSGKKVFVFTSLHYWIEYSAILSVALAGIGHRVTFSFLPYASWDKPIDKFDLRRQNLYSRQILSHCSSLLQVQSLLDVQPLSRNLPAKFIETVEQVSVLDTQYALKLEDISKETAVYKLRYERNLEAAQKARTWLMAHRPDVVIVPNGTIQEMSIVYRVAQLLDIPTVTFEFGDQRERIWIAQNSEIMQHNTDELWEARGETPLDDHQMQRLQDLFSAREGAKTWKNFARKWQDTATQGGESVRKTLALDDRPLVLLATNVFGDSLTLNRQVFSKSMAEWITKTVLYFSEHKDIQLVIRVHPGETLVHGSSMVDVVTEALGTIPAHIHLIKPDEKINTYDLVDIADLGLVYTTTVGLEMAMRGIPVIVAGQTHYRQRGFTHDPDSWDAYFAILNSLINNLESARLSQEQVEYAWRYAYLFFFEFPQPFPWHILDLAEDIENRPLQFVLSEQGQQKYSETFDYLTGKPMAW